MAGVSMGYPIVVNLTGKRVVVVGGGQVAERRVKGLIGQGAHIDVIAPSVTREIRQLADAGYIHQVVKSYEPEDLTGAFLVVAATDREDVNAAVASDGEKLNLLVCRADQAAGGNIITPAIVDRGDLMITITTSGASPTLTAVLKERLEDEFGPEWDTWARLFGNLRSTIAANPSSKERRRAVRRILADPQTQSCVKATQIDAAEEAARKCI